MRSCSLDEELSYKVSQAQQDDQGVRCDVQFAQARLLPPLAGQVDQDGQGEDDGETTGRSTEPQDGSDVWHEDGEENADYYDGGVQAQNLRETWNYNNSVKYLRTKMLERKA